MTLRSGKRLDYKTISRPKHIMLIQLPMKLKKLEHVCEALNSELRVYWIQCIYNCYDKIHNSISLSYPLSRKMVPNKKKVLPVRLSFEVKIIDDIDFYELKYRMCANESIIIEEQDYKISYAPTVDGESLRFMITIKMFEITLDYYN